MEPLPHDSHPSISITTATTTTTTKTINHCSGARSIFRRSIYTFLQNYHYFTSNVAFIALPFSASILLSQSLVPSSLPASLLPTIYGRLQAVFAAAGFPPTGLFTVATLKLSQTISSSILTIPFSLTFLLLAKALILNTLQTNDDHDCCKTRGRPTLDIPSLSSIMSLYSPLLHTSLWNSLLILSANATAFSILFFAFTLLQGLGLDPDAILLLSSAGAILYSIILANALVISNLALVLSGVEGRGGYMAILKACVLIRGRTTTALSLAVPISLAMAGIELLFQFRVVRAHHQKPGYFVAMEPLFIAYLYSILAILDTVVSYMFVKSCKKGFSMDQETARLFCYEVECTDEEMGGNMNKA